MTDNHQDLLVQAFLKTDGYVHAIFGTSRLLEDYAKWWEARRDGKTPHLAFTALLLRFCAGAAQSPSPSLVWELQAALGTSADHLSKHFHRAADDLANVVRPAEADVYHIMQYIMGASLLKNECRMVDAWHTLTSAVRSAQEIGTFIKMTIMFFEYS